MSEWVYLVLLWNDWLVGLQCLHELVIYLFERVLYFVRKWQKEDRKGHIPQCWLYLSRYGGWCISYSKGIILTVITVHWWIIHTHFWWYLFRYLFYLLCLTGIPWDRLSVCFGWVGWHQKKHAESLSQAFTGRYFSLDFKFGNFSYWSDSLNSKSAYCWVHLHPVGF